MALVFGSVTHQAFPLQLQHRIFLVLFLHLHLIPHFSFSFFCTLSPSTNFSCPFFSVPNTPLFLSFPSFFYLKYSSLPQGCSFFTFHHTPSDPHLPILFIQGGSLSRVSFVFRISGSLQDYRLWWCFSLLSRLWWLFSHFFLWSVELIVVTYSQISSFSIPISWLILVIFLSYSFVDIHRWSGTLCCKFVVFSRYSFHPSSQIVGSFKIGSSPSNLLARFLHTDDDQFCKWCCNLGFMLK